MHYITEAYRSRAADKQEISGEPVEILNNVILPSCTPDESPEHFKWAVITLWQWGRLQSFEAIYWLQIGRHISANERIENEDAYMRAYADRERSRAEGVAA